MMNPEELRDVYARLACGLDRGASEMSGTSVAEETARLAGFSAVVEAVDGATDPVAVGLALVRADVSSETLAVALRPWKVSSDLRRAYESGRAEALSHLDPAVVEEWWCRTTDGRWFSAHALRGSAPPTWPLRRGEAIGQQGVEPCEAR